MIARRLCGDCVEVIIINAQHQSSELMNDEMIASRISDNLVIGNRGNRRGGL